MYRDPLRELARRVATALEDAGIDVLHLGTLVMLLIVLSHYKDLKRWRDLKWDRKLWVGAVTYGLLIAVAISVLRLAGILDV